MHTVRWILSRASMIPLVWFIAHVTLLIWKAVDPNYLTYTKWIAANILLPLHPWIVWLVHITFPALETLVGNDKPTHENAPEVLYPLLMGIIGLIGAGAWALMRSRKAGIAQHHALRYWMGWTLRRAIIFPGVWIITRTGVFIWKAVDPAYVDKSQWVAEHILQNVHPYTVWVVSTFLPWLTTFANNSEPTYSDATKVYYPFFMGIIGLIWTAGYFGVLKVIAYRNRPPQQTLFVPRRGGGPDVSHLRHRNRRNK